MRKTLFSVMLFMLFAGLAMADTVNIKRFVIKENPFAQKEIAIVATDTLNQVQENISGKYTFTLNGFENELTFQNGTAFYRHKVEKSAFMFIKHKNESGSYSTLYYIYKHGDKLSPLRISWMWLVAIPLIIVFIGYLFKRFIVIAAIVLIIFLYFNYSKGLSIPTFFESIFDGLKHSIIG
ncbi:MULTISPECIES: hypothetical protein [unclassified Mucilaginibacter]|uniref:hypothetical protein n=1 Tax=unclassified Mucilaginibacter TaxID=2617802 RepID=UPI0031F63A6D